MKVERREIVARLRELAEHTDPTQPWQNKSEKVRFLLGVATIIEEEGRGVFVSWRIKNAAGSRVCDRGSMAECQELLRKYAEPGTYAGWSSGPYKIYRVTRRPKGARCSAESADIAIAERSDAPATATRGATAPESPELPGETGKGNGT